MIALQRPQAAAFCLAVAASGPDVDDAEGGEIARRRDSPLQVLIVEDEALVAMNMESALAEAGFSVAGVVDTEAAAIAAAERLRPDVVLMDITLRQGDGIAAARAIAARLETCIVFVSGNSDPGTLAAAASVRPAGFVRKPFVGESLARAVRDAITAPR